MAGRLNHHFFLTLCSLLCMVDSPSSTRQHSLSQFIWAEDRIQLPGKISLASSYKEYKVLFTQVLAI
jgi:hypothetical protein